MRTSCKEDGYRLTFRHSHRFNYRNKYHDALVDMGLSAEAVRPLRDGGDLVQCMVSRVTPRPDFRPRRMFIRISMGCISRVGCISYAKLAFMLRLARKPIEGQLAILSKEGFRTTWCSKFWAHWLLHTREGAEQSFAGLSRKYCSTCVSATLQTCMPSSGQRRRR